MVRAEQARSKVKYDYETERIFHTHTADGFEQDKTYEPENDISVLDDNDTRKTRLTLGDINSLRLASEAHDAQQKEEAVFTQKMYGQPAGTDDLAL